MKYNAFILVFSFFVLVACKSNETPEKETVVEPQFGEDSDDPNLPLDERAQKQAYFKLGIPTNEKCDIQLHQAYLNDDNLSDAIVTINRLAFAEFRCKNLKNYEILNRDGFVGNYNYIMIYDGATNKFSIPVPVPSSAKKVLNVDFEYIFSESYTTPVITYRIKDAEFKNFYRLSDGVMDKVFKMKSYEDVGKKTEKAYSYEIQKDGMFSFAKDIKVFDATLTNSQEISNDWFGTKAEIKPTKTLNKVWYFDPKRNGYVTPN